MEINAGNFNDLLVKAYNKYLDEAGCGDDHFDSMTQEVIAEGAYSLAGFELDGYTIDVAADVGGGEGDGEERYIVYSVTDGTKTRYFRYDGYYASWDGSTFENLEPRKVKAKKKVVVVFE